MLKKGGKYSDQSKTITQRTKNKMFGVIYSRTAIVLLLLVAQIAFFILALTRLEAYSKYMYGVSVIMSIICVIYIVNEEGNPAFKLTWLTFVLVFPLV